MSPHLLSTFACQNVSLAGFLISPLLTPISPEVCSVDCSIHNTRDIAAVQCCFLVSTTKVRLELLDVRFNYAKSKNNTGKIGTINITNHSSSCFQVLEFCCFGQFLLSSQEGECNKSFIADFIANQLYCLVSNFTNFKIGIQGQFQELVNFKIWP